MDKIKTLIGFAIKSRNVIYGFDNIEKKRTPPKIIFVCPSLAENSLTKIKTYAAKHSVPLMFPKDEPLSDIVSKTNCKVLALTDKMLAKGILETKTDSYAIILEVNHE